MDSIEAVVKAALFRSHREGQCPRYLAALDQALEEELPPFATTVYREMVRLASADRQWMAVTLVTRVQQHGESAKRFWGLGARCTDTADQHVLRRNAIDHSRHGVACLELLDICFPGMLTSEFRTDLAALLPNHAEAEPFDHELTQDSAPGINEFLYLNIAELRSVCRLIEQRRALEAHCEPEHLPRAMHLQDSLLHDLLCHVASTAVLVECKAADVGPGELKSRFCACLRDFNRATCEESIEFSYHMRFGNYP